MKLYNTLTRQVDELVTLTPDLAKIYTCGLTVYSQPHIGNWVGYIYWDVLVRTLEAEGYTVDRIQNITDVGHLVSDDDNGEDKMEKGARAEGITAWEVAQKYIDIADHEGYELLGLKKPTLIRATDCIKEQIAFVQTLEEKGYTYTIEQEGIYFDTAKLSDYGKLAKLDTKGLEAGSRVAFKNKRNVTDFALWKFSPQDKKRDMEWDSPWGVGFPGWHLECSVIAHTHLGEQIDIHTGGIDHIPIHHTNEIAQTETVTGKQFASIWVHNNHLKVDGSKMAKSVGNIYTLDDIVQKGFSLQAFKLLVLSKNYYTEGNFTWEIMEAAQNRYTNWCRFVDTQWQLPANPKDITSELVAALGDNLSTAEAVKLIDEYISSCEQAGQSAHPASIDTIESLLGITLKREDITPVQKKLLAERAKARSSKDWSAADTLRDTLQTQGIAINDAADKQIWYRL